MTQTDLLIPLLKTDTNKERKSRTKIKKKKPKQTN